jgi:hypothetical protein
MFLCSNRPIVFAWEFTFDFEICGHRYYFLCCNNNIKYIYKYNINMWVQIVGSKMNFYNYIVGEKNDRVVSWVCGFVGPTQITHEGLHH